MRYRFVLLFLLFCFSSPAFAETVICPASRDTWISSVGDEKDINMGKSRKVKLKFVQEYGLIDFDVSSLKGKKNQRGLALCESCRCSQMGPERWYRSPLSLSPLSVKSGTKEMIGKIGLFTQARGQPLMNPPRKLPVGAGRVQRFIMLHSVIKIPTEQKES